MLFMMSSLYIFDTFILGPNSDFSRKFYPPDFQLLSYSKIKLSAALYLLISWVLGNCLKYDCLRTCVGKQSAGGCWDGGRGSCSHMDVSEVQSNATCQKILQLPLAFCISNFPVCCLLSNAMF